MSLPTFCPLCLETYFVQKSNFLQTYDVEALKKETGFSIIFLEKWFENRRHVNLNILERFYEVKPFVSTWDVTLLMIKTGRTAKEIQKWFDVERRVLYMTPEQQNILKENYRMNPRPSELHLKILSNLAKTNAGFWFARENLKQWFLNSELKNVLGEYLNQFPSEPGKVKRKQIAKQLNSSEKKIKTYFESRRANSKYAAKRPTPF